MGGRGEGRVAWAWDGVMGDEDSPLVIVRAGGPGLLAWVLWNSHQMRRPCE